MGLFNRIVEQMRMGSASKLAVVVNAEYLLYDQKMVYVQLVRRGGDKFDLDFYVSTYDEDSVSRVSVSVPNAFSTIHSMTSSQVLFGVSVQGTPSVDDCTVTVSNELRMLIIESAVYHVTRSLAEKEAEGGFLDYSSVSVRFSVQDQRESVDTVTRLLQAFKKQSLALYADLVYAGGSNRFINRLQKAYKFYTIQKSFIPVFINCNLFYNPLNDGVIKRTVLYKAAADKNRLITVDSAGMRLSCYFMTHEEICRAFGMRHFMRFTPSFWYLFFVGAVFPNVNGPFPNRGTKRWYAPKKLIAGSGLKQSYTDAELLELRNKHTADSGMLQFLDLYEEHDTLFMACQDVHAQLTSFGPVSLDNRDASSAQALYTYLCEASVALV